MTRTSLEGRLELIKSERNKSQNHQRGRTPNQTSIPTEQHRYAISRVV